MQQIKLSHFVDQLFIACGYLYFFFFAQDYSYDQSEEWPPVGRIITRNIRKLYNDRTKVLKDRFPILKWAPTYKLDYLFHDFIAGFTVGLTAIPQGIAYAIVAGLPPQYGLYSGFIGSFVYLIFGSSKDITIGELSTLHITELDILIIVSIYATGPTAILALLIQRYVAENLEFAILLAFINGALIFLFGILNLGCLVQFISVPVSSTRSQSHKVIVFDNNCGNIYFRSQLVSQQRQQ